MKKSQITCKDIQFRVKDKKTGAEGWISMNELLDGIEKTFEETIEEEIEKEAKKQSKSK